MVQQTNQNVLTDLDKVLTERRSASPGSSYVATLYDKGLNKILEKIGEEATEVILAAKDHQHTSENSGENSGENKSEQALIGEVADLWFHTMILLSSKGLSSADVTACLQERFGLSGHVEKASRDNSSSDSGQATNKTSGTGVN